MKFERPLLMTKAKKSETISQFSDKTVKELMFSANAAETNHFYYDEVSLSAFTEIFLDFFIKESHKNVMRKRDQVSTKLKVIRDILLLLETDRALLKFHNCLVLRYLQNKEHSPEE